MCNVTHKRRLSWGNEGCLRRQVTHPPEEAFDAFEDGLQSSRDHWVVAPGCKTTAVRLQTHTVLGMGERYAEFKGYAFIDGPSVKNRDQAVSVVDGVYVMPEDATSRDMRGYPVTDHLAH
jgi:hypothetical protein